MDRRWLPFRRFAAALAVVAWAGAGPAAAADVHDYFEGQCGACHAHAIDLSRKMKFDPGGRLIGLDSNRDIRRFLDRHHAGDAAMAEAVYALFARQAASGGEFRRRCAVCHGRARELVRERLALSAGRLVGRYSGKDVGDFLLGHASLGPAEAKFFRDVLQLIAEGR